MLSIMFAVLAIAFLVLVILLELLLLVFRKWDVGKLRRVLTQSANHNLFLHELPFFILMIDLPFLVAETQSPLLQDMFPTIWIQVGAWIPIIVLLAFFNAGRFGRLGLVKRKEKLIYSLAEEVVERSRIPEVGLDEALAYIRNVENELSFISERGFLQHLVARNDSISEIALKKLQQL